MELVLIRHGLPLRVETDDGTPADPPLSEEGHGQARRVADWLAADPLDALYASPLLRARQTAAPLAEKLALPVDIEPGVIEFDADSDQYVPLEELREKDYDRWLALMQGGYQDAYDMPAYQRAVADALGRIIDRHAGQRVAVFCHGGVINVWAAGVIGSRQPLFFQPGYTSVHRFLASSRGDRSVLSLNELAHLRS